MFCYFYWLGDVFVSPNTKKDEKNGDITGVSATQDPCSCTCNGCVMKFDSYQYKAYRSQLYLLTCLKFIQPMNTQLLFRSITL